MIANGAKQIAFDHDFDSRLYEWPSSTSVPNSSSSSAVGSLVALCLLRLFFFVLEEEVSLGIVLRSSYLSAVFTAKLSAWSLH